MKKVEGFDKLLNELKINHLSNQKLILLVEEKEED